MRKTKVEKAAEIINNKLGLNLNPKTFIRTYAGYHQKSLGAFVWWMYVEDTPHWYGSCDTITYIVNSKNKQFHLLGHEIIID